MMGGNQQAAMRMLQQMEERARKMQEDLAKQTVEGSAGGGAVSVAMNGHMQVESVTLDPSAVDPEDVEMLQDLLVAAFNDAQGKAQKVAAKAQEQLQSQMLGGLPPGMKIPGLM